ncbi:MAG TPA: zf-HC2 domain-containing protein [Pyrinomonadaceae bacterium]|nr:zf-HC2 domain-containing protein [Pyrinomonadaceae bacterium]
MKTDLPRCEEIRGRLTLYLDNELQGEERATIEAHLSECEACASIFARELNFLKAVRESGPLHVASPKLRAKVEESLSERRTASLSSGAGRRGDLRYGWLVATAAGLLVLLLPVVVWRLVRIQEPSSTKRPSSFALMAADTHLRRTRGQLPLEMESASPQDISTWFSNKVNFHVKLPNYQESSGQEKLYTLEGARLVGFQNDYAAYVAYRMGDRPISLVITSESAAKPSGGEEIAARGLTFHYNAINGLKVLTWSDRGLTYALVSDLEERGQQSCIVCHEGSKDQDFIEPLKPH